MRKQRQPFCLATPFHRSATLRFVIPSEAEGSAVPRTSLGKRAFCPASTFHRIGRKTFPRKVRRTAGPSALLGMTKGRVALPFGFVIGIEGTAGPSTSLRFGRDDTSVWGLGLRWKNWEVRGAHCRSLGYARDDKGERGASIQSWLLGSREQQVPPLRYASVRMTRLFGGWGLDGKIGRSEGRTTDNPGTLGMTKGRVAPDLKRYAGCS